MIDLDPLAHRFYLAEVERRARRRGIGARRGRLRRLVALALSRLRAA